MSSVRAAVRMNGGLRALVVSALMLVIPATASAHHLGDLVWQDTNNNGRVDLGEPGIPNVTLELRNPAGGLLGTTTTDANGIYGFFDLAPGEFVVRIPNAAVQIPGCVTSTGTPGSAVGPHEPAPDANDPTDNDDNGQKAGTDVEIAKPVVLTEVNQNNERIDFGFFCPAALGDFVWEDTDKDGVQDAGEPGIGGATVTLHTVCGGPTILTTTTDASGRYEFTGLIPGTYVVDFGTPSGYTPTVSAGALNDPLNSDASPQTGCSPAVTLGVKEVNPRVDAGFVKTPVPAPVTSSVPPAPTPVLPPATPTVAALPPARIAITKRGPATAAAGSVITYRIVVRASAKGASALDVVVRDVLPSGLTLVSNSVQNARTRRSAAVGWDVGTLKPGASKTVTVRVRIGRNVVGPLTNVAFGEASNAPRVRAQAITTVTRLPRAVTPRVTG